MIASAHGPVRPVWIARLKSDVKCCAASAFAGLFEGDNFRVVAPVVLMKSFAENCAVLHDHAADGGMGLARPMPLRARSSACSMK